MWNIFSDVSERSEDKAFSRATLPETYGLILPYITIIWTTTDYPVLTLMA